MNKSNISKLGSKESIRVAAQVLFDPKEKDQMMKVIKKAQDGDYKNVNLDNVQCFRCKLYGHKNTSKECPLYRHGRKLAEHHRKFRLDPMQKLVEDKDGNEDEMFVKGDPTLDEKLVKLMTLCRLIKEEKKKKKKEKKKRKESKKRKRDEYDDFEENSRHYKRRRV